MAFHDLNVPVASEHEASSLSARLANHVKLGYSCVAINQLLQGRITTPVSPIFPSDGVALPPLANARLRTAGRRLRVLSRCTVVVSDPSEAHALSGNFTALLRNFDIVAARPLNERMFAQCTEKLDVDLISLDLSQRLPFTLRAPQIRQALSRGIYFEICYSAALLDSRARRQLIASAQQLVRLSKGRGIILSSGTVRALHLRSPHDAANLSRLFGLSQNQAKEAVARHPKSVCSHARMRRNTWKGLAAARRVVDEGGDREKMDCKEEEEEEEKKRGV